MAVSIAVGTGSGAGSAVVREPGAGVKVVCVKPVARVVGAETRVLSTGLAVVGEGRGVGTALVAAGPGVRVAVVVAARPRATEAVGWSDASRARSERWSREDLPRSGVGVAVPGRASGRWSANITRASPEGAARCIGAGEVRARALEAVLLVGEWPAEISPDSTAAATGEAAARTAEVARPTRVSPRRGDRPR